MITQASADSSICVVTPTSDAERALRCIEAAFQLELQRKQVASIIRGPPPRAYQSHPVKARQQVASITCEDGPNGPGSCPPSISNPSLYIFPNGTQKQLVLRTIPLATCIGS